jgi:phosphoribosylformylglycinamidine cyclo-ligase
VDIEQANRAIRSIEAAIRQTHGPRVLGNVGGFAGLFAASFPEVAKPVLVSSIDGVGTKTKVAAMAGSFEGLGLDIVHHCVNDILCQGARPLFFLDYFGCSRLSGPVFEAVVKGMAQACLDTGCALIGGETAEMPGVYADDEIEVVGAIVGLVDQDRMLPRGKMQPGDLIVGVASNGLHTNGYSLARRALFELGGLSVRDEAPGLGTTLAEELLRPHKCYLSALAPLVEEDTGVYALAHITGGGLADNMRRVMPSNVRARVETRSWTPLPVFRLIQSCGGVSDIEMYRTFNMGIGMVAFVAREAAAAVVQRLQMAGESAAVIGELDAGPVDVSLV